MAAVDPYSPCPCGSGQKFKWCCQKVEPVAERAQRLFESGQIAGAIEALDEGLRKDPQNAWLLTRKAIYLLRRGEPDAAKGALRRVLQKQPKHAGATVLLTRLVLETESPVAGAAHLQRALMAFEPGERKPLSGLVRVVGMVLAEAGLYPAALRHLELAQQLGDAPAGGGDSGLRVLEANPAVSPWQKNAYRLAEPPADAPAGIRDRFAQALEWAGAGLWDSAAAAFELLSTEPAAAAAADRNLGLCRLWMADYPAAVAALRRAIARAGATTEAVDLEALCQEISPPRPDDLVEQVQWIWTLRDRDGLLEALRRDPKVREEGAAPIDPDDPESPEVDQFGLLDQPQIAAARGLSPGQVPRYLGRVLVGREIVALESYDDGRLDALGERFATLAGATIARAHPKTKVLSKIARSTLALSWEFHLPEGMDEDEVERLTREQGVAMVREVWPRTPMPYLRGRTPLAAAAAGDAEVPLRAAVMQLEHSNESWRGEVDLAALREQLRIGPEPAIDPETVDIERLHLARLTLVPVDRLDDRRLVEFYRRAKRTMQGEAIEQATRILIDRPALAATAGADSLVLHADMAVLAAGRRLDEAFDWIRRGRQADPLASRLSNAPIWDMLEIRLKARSQPPETWVPELAVVMDRYSNDPAGNEKIMMALIDMRLISLVAPPDKPDDVMIDPRPLQALLAEYGPRVTTASGQLGVAATKGEIWTPGAATGGGAIWTPGSGPAASTSAPAEKPKLIIPGR